MLPNPFRAPHPVWLLGSVTTACAGLWLVFWPPDSMVYLLGGPLLGFGGAVAAVQLSLWRSVGLERQVAPAELQAWLMLAFVGGVLAVGAGSLEFGGASSLRREGGHFHVMLALLVVVYAFLSLLLRVCQQGNVVKDERDQQIAIRAGSYGRSALIFYIFSLMVMLGFSPPEKLQWATPVAIATHLFLAVFVGWVVEYAAVVMLYWRDRR